MAFVYVWLSICNRSFGLFQTEKKVSEKKGKSRESFSGSGTARAESYKMSSLKIGERRTMLERRKLFEVSLGK